MNLSSLEAASLWSNIVVVVLTVLAAIAGVFAFNVAAVVLTVPAAIAGAFALYFSSRLGALKDAEVKQIAEQERLARVQIEARLESRRMSIVLFDEALKGNPAGTAEIVYLRDDGEAFFFAEGVFGALQANGWLVDFPTPVQQSVDPRFSRLPTLMSVQGQPLGVTIVAKSAEPDLTGQKAPVTPLQTLCSAFMASGRGFALGFDATFPDNSFRIVIRERTQHIVTRSADVRRRAQGEP
jgi:hypothetical protein